MIDLHGAKSMAEMVPDDVWKYVGYLLVLVGSWYTGHQIGKILSILSESRNVNQTIKRMEKRHGK